MVKDCWIWRTKDVLQWLSQKCQDGRTRALLLSISLWSVPFESVFMLRDGTLTHPVATATDKWLFLKYPSLTLLSLCKLKIHMVTDALALSTTEERTIWLATRRTVAISLAAVRRRHASMSSQLSLPSNELSVLRTESNSWWPHEHHVSLFIDTLLTENGRSNSGKMKCRANLAKREQVKVCSDFVGLAIPLI